MIQSEALIKEFKRRGHFDELRRSLLEEFSSSPQGQQLKASLIRLASETEATSKTSLIAALGKSNLFNAKRGVFGGDLLHSADFQGRIRGMLESTMLDLAASKESAAGEPPVTDLPLKKVDAQTDKQPKVVEKDASEDQVKSFLDDIVGSYQSVHLELPSGPAHGKNETQIMSKKSVPKEVLEAGMKPDVDSIHSNDISGNNSEIGGGPKPEDQNETYSMDMDLDEPILKDIDDADAIDQEEGKQIEVNEAQVNVVTDIPDVFEEHQAVAAFYNGKCYLANIVEIDRVSNVYTLVDTYQVYEELENEKSVEPYQWKTNIVINHMNTSRFQSIAEGDHVYAMYIDDEVEGEEISGEFYPALVIARKSEDQIQVEFEDGDQSWVVIGQIVKRV